MPTDAAGLMRDESDGLDIGYQTIADILLAICPAPFDRVTLEASLGDGFFRVALTCVDAKGQRHSVLVPSLAASSIDDVLLDLQRGWPTQPPFSTCAFILFPDGTFKFDVGYGD